MTGKTVTRADLAEAVYREIGLSRNESAKLVESVLSLISDGLARGETVKISSFGSFSVRTKGQRIGRNPKTGDEVPIMPRKVLVFRASHVLKDWINGVPPGARKGDAVPSAGAEAPGLGSDGSGMTSHAPAAETSSPQSTVPGGESPGFGGTGHGLPGDPPDRGGSSGA